MKYTYEDYNRARIAGSFLNAARIALTLALDPGMSLEVRDSWKREAHRMQIKSRLFSY